MNKIHFIIIKKAHIACFLLIALIFCMMYFFLNDSLTVGTSNYVDMSMPPNPGNTGKLAIIIDDFGQNRNGVEEMMSIEAHLTFAVMPFMTFSQSDAENAYNKGYEVIVHLPLEASGGKLSWVGPRPIMADMSEDKVKAIVNDSFESVPHAVGANIHMGSKAGEDENVISSILDVIKSKRLFFVDSRSCRHPIAKSIADNKGVVCFERNIFLDGGRSISAIKKQLETAGKMALDRGEAVAIGHVGTEGGRDTAQAIAEMLPEFKEKGIRIVFTSELGKK